MLGYVWYDIHWCNVRLCGGSSPICSCLSLSQEIFVLQVVGMQQRPLGNLDVNVNVSNQLLSARVVQLGTDVPQDIELDQRPVEGRPEFVQNVQFYSLCRLRIACIVVERVHPHRQHHRQHFQLIAGKFLAIVVFHNPPVSPGLARGDTLVQQVVVVLSQLAKTKIHSQGQLVVHNCRQLVNVHIGGGDT